MDEAIIEDATLVETEEPPKTDDAAMVLELETMIKNNLATIDRNKAELKKLKEMVESALQNSETYRDATEKAKEAAKVKGKIKLEVMQNPQTKQLSEKLKDLQTEIKEANEGISEYLREYQRMSGSNEIQTDDGTVLEIINISKLIKKSSR